jgi:hypothetical protein
LDINMASSFSSSTLLLNVTLLSEARLTTPSQAGTSGYTCWFHVSQQLWPPSNMKRILLIYLIHYLYLSWNVNILSAWICLFSFSFPPRWALEECLALSMLSIYGMTK